MTGLCFEGTALYTVREKEQSKVTLRFLAWDIEKYWAVIYWDREDCRGSRFWKNIVPFCGRLTLGILSLFTVFQAWDWLRWPREWEEVPTADPGACQCLEDSGTRGASKQSMRGGVSADRGKAGGWSQGALMRFTHVVNKGKCKPRHQWDETSRPLGGPLPKKKKTKQKIKSIGWGMEVEKLRPLFTAGGNVKWYSCYWKQTGSPLKKLNTELPYDPLILLLGIYPKELKPGTQTDICMLTFTSALFKIAKRWKQTKCPETDEWINKMWYIHTREYDSDTIYNIDEPLRHYPQWNKPITKGEILYGSTHMRYLEESNSQRQKTEWRIII